MQRPTLKQVKRAVKENGYQWFERGNYNLNIVGIRNSSTRDKVTNKFDDWITLSYKKRDKWVFKAFSATTDPGTHFTKNLINSKGVAILVPGQYRSAYKIRLHAGKYEAICQHKYVKVYRDKNRDMMFDMLEENIDEGKYGINIHRATKHGTSNRIDKWSAGCQVIANTSDFFIMMAVAHESARIWGNKFTYTLIESEDIRPSGLFSYFS